MKKIIIQLILVFLSISGKNFSAFAQTTELGQSGKKTIPSLQFASPEKHLAAEPKKVLIHYLGWYGDSLASDGDYLRHWIYGCAHTPLIGEYDSRSRALQTYHLLLSWACGIDGMIMNIKDPFDEQSMKIMLSTIKKIRNIDSLNFNYNFAISYDDQGMDKSYPLDTTIAKLGFLKDSILQNDPFYLHYNSEPAIFVYNYAGMLSAKGYRIATDSVFKENTPMLIWNQIDTSALGYANSFYPWVGPDDSVWDKNGLIWGKKYLEWFYPTANGYSKYLDFVTGGVWPGFDDRKNTEWGKNRWMDRKNRVVYDSTWYFVNSYKSVLPLKWVIIETWNDWNEGTEIEPSVEYRYQYLISTIKNINTFKGTSLSSDTCKFYAAGKIYSASYMIEHNQRDSATYYPVLKRSIKSFLSNNCEMAINTIDTISNNYSKVLNDEKINIEIYPNPAKDNLYIKLSDDLPANVEIFNLEGCKIYSKKTIGNIGIIDISQLTKGIYLIKISKNNEIIHSKFFKL